MRVGQRAVLKNQVTKRRAIDKSLSKNIYFSMSAIAAPAKPFSIFNYSVSILF